MSFTKFLRYVGIINFIMVVIALVLAILVSNRVDALQSAIKMALEEPDRNKATNLFAVNLHNHRSKPPG